MSLGDGTEDCGEERHAQQAGRDATWAGLQLVEPWGVALDLQRAFTGIAVCTLREEQQAHTQAHQHVRSLQEQAQEQELWKS